MARNDDNTGGSNLPAVTTSITFAVVDDVGSGHADYNTDVTMVATTAVDPYYIHPVEYPNDALVTPALTEDNYASWCVNMERALSVKAKVRFIDGSLPEPADLSKFKLWKRA